MALTLFHPAAAQGDDTAWDTLERILTVHEQMVERHRDEEAYRERVAEESWEESLEGLVLKLEPGAMNIRMRNLAIGRSGSILINDPQPTLQALAREPRYLKLRELATQGPASVRRGIHERTRDWLEDWTAQLAAQHRDIFADLANPEVVPLLHVQSSDDALEAGLRVLRFLEAELVLYTKLWTRLPMRPDPAVTRYLRTSPNSGMSIAGLQYALDRMAAQPERYMGFHIPATIILQNYARCTQGMDAQIMRLMPLFGAFLRTETDLTPEALKQELDGAGFWEKASIARNVPGTPDCPGLRDMPQYVHETFTELAFALKNGKS